MAMRMVRRLIEAIYGRRTTRQIWKLKSLLNLTVCRLSVLRNQRNGRCCIARSDIMQLLLHGQQDRALIRAELLIKEQNMADVFAMVASYCQFLNDRAFLLEQQMECPEELKEAAAGLSFAASRCGELPELQEVRKIISSRFGKEFTAAAVELRNNCGVDAKMVQKFSSRKPSMESRVDVMKEIARERGVELELITNPFSEVSVVDDQFASLWTENQAEEMATPQLDSAFHGNYRGKERVEEEYKDVVSAAQAAFESASYAAVAAKAALELFQLEVEGALSH
ncbi:hypothetical protein KFK09_022038 [Dendrobium nobile]|uniref:Regulator of Vps4 activity in the MVB pathway protein n=1 Tax=Dendrobium nobile TaxID=94219 RepID=A0A8T3ANH6_DENNO|nr:hypothetical protein KFK09_022038 [Dendrobium nobile]